MRPHKHVAQKRETGARARFTEVMDTELARLGAPWGEVPVVATTELEVLTVWYWNPLAARWESHRIDHHPLVAEGSDPGAPEGWNRSDRVALVTIGSIVHVVFKRQIDVGGAPVLGLFHARYGPATSGGSTPDGRLQHLGTSTLAEPLPLGSRAEVGYGLRALAAEDGTLLVLHPRRLSTFGQPFGPWSLRLRRFTLDGATGAVTSETSEVVGPGGFDFDARLEGSTLHVVHRESPEAFRMPLFMMAGGRSLTSGADADPFFEPFQWTRLDLTGQRVPVQESLPGGEHPQIQRTTPFLLTYDRPSTLTVSLDTPLLPLPPRRPGVIFVPGVNDTVTWIREGTATFRGTLLKADARTLPRSLASFAAVSALCEDRSGLWVQRSPFATNPVFVLDTLRDDKTLRVDLLHHREHLGLYRSRIHLTLSEGIVSVAERAFDVWDIGHLQIRDFEDLTPPADAENRQFEPVDELVPTRAPRVSIPALTADNTIGGNLRADTTRTPVGFFSYTDLGDGGLRVQYAPDIEPLVDPPPIEDEKTLRPDQVTGPPIPCDVWIELTGAGWRPAELPGYEVGVLQARRSLGSALEVPIGFLLDSADIVTGNGDAPDGVPIDPADSLTIPQLTAIDTFRARLTQPLVRTIGLSDGTSCDVTLSPGGLVAGVALSLSATFPTPPSQVGWTAVRVRDLPEGFTGPFPALAGGVPVGTPLPMAASGNPATLTPDRPGDWRISVFTAAPDGTTLAAGFVDVRLLDSSYALLTGLYDGIAEGEWHRIGDLEATLLTYDLRYGVGAIGNRPVRIRIVPRLRRATELRFRRGEAGQGVVDARHLLSFVSDEMQLKHGLDLLFHVNGFAVTLPYRRAYTPGMLMRDTRFRDVLDGHALDPGTETIIRDEVERHAGIGCKPIGDGAIDPLDVEVDLSLTAGAITVTAILLALTLIGAAAAVAAITYFLAGIAAAMAVGIAGLALALVLTVALTIYIAITVPKVVADFAEDQVSAAVRSPDQLERLNELPLLRYSGEGAAEAVAREVLQAARDAGFAVPAAADFDTPEIGHERTWGQLFQMVFVSQDRCRVLLRLEDCDPTHPPDIGLPDPPDIGDDGEPPLVGTGRG